MFARGRTGRCDVVVASSRAAMSPDAEAMGASDSVFVGSTRNGERSRVNTHSPAGRAGTSALVIAGAPMSDFSREGNGGDR